MTVTEDDNVLGSNINAEETEWVVAFISLPRHAEYKSGTTILICILSIKSYLENVKMAVTIKIHLYPGSNLEYTKCILPVSYLTVLYST